MVSLYHILKRKRLLYVGFPKLFCQIKPKQGPHNSPVLISGNSWPRSQSQQLSLPLRLLPQIPEAYQSQAEKPATEGHKVIGLGFTEKPCPILTHDAREERVIQYQETNLLSKLIIIYKSNGQVFIPTPSQLTSWVYIIVFNQN